MRKLVAFFLFAVPSASFAQSIPFQCLDGRGIVARVMENPAVQDVAVASIDPAGRPLISTNEVFARRMLGNLLTPNVILFVMYHECGHLQLGFVRNGLRMSNDLENEIAADVWAIRELFKRGFTNAQFEEVYRAFGVTRGGDSVHFDGPARVTMMKLTLDHFRRHGP